MMAFLLWVLLIHSSIAIALHSVAPSVPSSAASTDTTSIIPPGKSFPCTLPGVQVSVASLNLLAPSYHFLNRDDDDDGTKMEQQDRNHRVPLAINQAKQTNADILLLQEVEGRSQHEPLLEKCLSTPITIGETSISGYDSYIWSALYPNRIDDVVGNAVAWRSDRFQLVSHESFRRGMIVQLQDVKGNTLVVANLHLFAKPSAIERRLKTMSATIKRIQSLELPSQQSPLDGTVILAGDFNCDHPSVTTQLATLGYAPHGRINDRNYKAKITKATAATMRHSYRFRHVYHHQGTTTSSIAPITVSLKGRGPGCMDHMLFVSGHDRQQQQPHTRRLAPVAGFSKRKGRRQRATERVHKRIVESDAAIVQPLRVQSLLATVGDDENRLRIIRDGLPNVPMGFPSDHLPIGAMFGPDPSFIEKEKPKSVVNGDDTRSVVAVHGHSNLSPRALKRRQAHARSSWVLQRHNSVLRAVAEWLLEHGATSMIRDQPLYKWKWTQGAVGLRKKMRAPDICCRADSVLCIIEVTVVRQGNVDTMRREKIKKYRDLVPILQEKAPVVQKEGVTTVAPVFILAMDDKGRVPDSTKQEIHRLATLVSSSDETNENAASLVKSLEALFSSSV